MADEEDRDQALQVLAGDSVGIEDNKVAVVDEPETP